MLRRGRNQESQKPLMLKNKNSELFRDARCTDLQKGCGTTEKRGRGNSLRRGKKKMVFRQKPMVGTDRFDSVVGA